MADISNEFLDDDVHVYDYVGTRLDETSEWICPKCGRWITAHGAQAVMVLVEGNVEVKHYNKFP